MAKEDKLTVFAIGNGDSILIEARGKRILTDINLKSDPTDNLPDLEEELRDACGHGALHLFVLTHPDEDHLRGFADVFHTGNPLASLVDKDYQ